MASGRQAASTARSRPFRVLPAGTSSRPDDATRRPRREPGGMKRLLAAALGVVAVCGLISGCSGGLTPSGSPSTASSDAALCASVDDLRTSIADVQALDVVKDGTADVTAGLKAVKSDLEQVVKDAQKNFRTQVDDVKAGLGSVEAAVKDAAAAPSATTLSAVATQLRALGTDVT